MKNIFHRNSKVERIFSKTLKSSGLDFFAICSIDADEFISVKGMPRRFCTNFPDEWVSHYMDKKLYFRDPVLRTCAMTSVATDWSDLANARKCTHRENQVIQDARHFGILSGIGLSVHGLDGSTQIVSLASRSRARTHPDTLAHLTLGAIKLARLFAQSERDRLDAQPELSIREQECLTWVALGKSSSEISDILEVSSNTVDFHIKRTMNKLHAANRTFAVVRALRLGLINP